MSNDPDQLRDDIEATRSELSANVNALADSVRPGAVARRQADKVKSGMSEVKDRVMGVAEDVGAQASGSADRAGTAAGTAQSSALATTRGNPLAAGLIAFGIGWLVGSLLPASAVEQNAASTVKDRAAPLAEAAKQGAQELAANLRGPAEDAVQEVKATAAEAAGTLGDQARSSATQVADASKQAAQEVRDQSDLV